MTPPIAILGAGPSGLTFARLLELNNIDYVVFERDTFENASKQLSGTLDLHKGSGQLALQEAGLFEQFQAKARYDTPFKMADWQGNILLRLAEEGPSDRPEIDRVDLRRILLDSLPEERIQWSSKVSSIERTSDEQMAVSFADGRQEGPFRLVVAADGAWSKARSLITDATPCYSGLHYLTTKLSPDSEWFAEAQELVGKGAYLAIGRGKQISAQKLGDDSYYIAVGLSLPEHWVESNAQLAHDPQALRQYLLGTSFAQWPELHTNLIKHSNSAFRAWPLYAMDPDALSWKTVPGIALLGDAAHVSTPFVGEGVNCSMYDSVMLARAIVCYGLDHLSTAVEVYEAEMLPRGRDLVTRSQESGKLMFAADAPAGFLEFLASQ